jgi:hypothetical protein
VSDPSREGSGVFRELFHRGARGDRLSSSVRLVCWHLLGCGSLPADIRTGSPGPGPGRQRTRARSLWRCRCDVGLGLGTVVPLSQKPIRLGPTSLAIPRGRTPLVIPIEDIAGVGLAFKHTVPPHRAPPIGWYLMVWRRDGTAERTAISWLPTRYRKGASESSKLSWSAKGFDPVVGTDRSALEASRAAQVARDVYTRILTIQGPGGPLATGALQRHPDPGRFSVSPVTAWWSPDGELGRPGG